MRKKVSQRRGDPIQAQTRINTPKSPDSESATASRRCSVPSVQAYCTWRLKSRPHLETTREPGQSKEALKLMSRFYPYSIQSTKVVQSKRLFQYN